MLKQDRASIFSMVEQELQFNADGPLPESVYHNHSSNSLNVGQELFNVNNNSIHIEMQHLPIELISYIQKCCLLTAKTILDNSSNWQEFMEDYNRKMDEMLLGSDIAR